MKEDGIRDPWNPYPLAVARVKDALPPPAKCDCCGGKVRIAHHREIYGGRTFSDWPWVYLCDCGARVGMHPQTNLPLGTMADAATRGARQNAKPAFDSIWRSEKMSRTEAYAWLAVMMSLPLSRCHFGMFTIKQCEKARRICQAFTESQPATPATAPDRPPIAAHESPG